MEVKNGMTYKSNYARAAAYYLGTCAPAPNDVKRLKAYKVITGIYEFIAENAEAAGFNPVADVYFAPWEQQKGREKDIKYIRGAIAAIEELVFEFFKLVESSEACESGMLLPENVVPGRKLKKILTSSGVGISCSDGKTVIEIGKDCFEGLKELAAISRENIIHITDGPKEDKPYLYFSRCVFEPSENWTAQAFDKLLGAEGRLVALCKELEKRGYRRIDCRDGKTASLDYVKQHGKKEEPVKMAWSERTHSGISLTYEELRLEPCFLWVRMPMFRTVLEHGGELSEKAAEFIKNNTKTCNGCRYCVQTDKTHTRPISAIKLGGVNKCPLYPGFTMNWRRADAELIDNIIATLDATDAVLDAN